MAGQYDGGKRSGDRRQVGNRRHLLAISRPPFLALPFLQFAHHGEDRQPFGYRGHQFRRSLDLFRKPRRPLHGCLGRAILDGEFGGRRFGRVNLIPRKHPISPPGRGFLHAVIAPADKQPERIRGQVAAAKLVAVYPVLCRVPVGKFEADDLERQPQPRADFIAVVAVQKDAVPHGQRVTASMGDDVGLKLVALVRRQRRNLSLKAVINNDRYYALILPLLVKIKSSDIRFVIK